MATDKITTPTLKIATNEDVIFILDLISCTGRTVSQMCRANKIEYSSFWKMLRSDSSLMDKYKPAKIMQMEIVADEMLDIIDYHLDKDDTGKYSAVLMSQRKEQLETRKWILTKLLSNVYGEGSKEMEQDIQIDI